MSERGIDVFELYQGAVDWRAVAASGVRHALIKLTNGANVAGPPGDHYVAGAKSAGLRVGGYCYALGGNPVAQADRFADELLRLNALDDAPELDYEDPSVPQDAGGAQAWITRFFAQLHARIPWLTRVLLYSSGSMLTRIGAGSISAPGLQVLIWDAEYSVNDGSEHPMRYYTGPVAIHQYTSAGTVPGISGAVDLDDVYTDITEDDVSFTDIIGHRADGSPFTAADALANLYLGGYYGGGDAGPGAVFPTVNAINAKLDALAGALSENEANIVAAIRAQATSQVDVADLAARLTTSLGPAVAAELGRRLAATGGTQ